MKYFLFAFSIVFSNSISLAQHISLALQKPPLMDETVRVEQWAALEVPMQVSFVNSNTRYAKEQVPAIEKKNEVSLTAWKGEKVHTQIAVWGNKAINALWVSAGDLQSTHGNRISRENISIGFVGYVLTDEFRDGCGGRQTKDFDSSLVADPINNQITSTGFSKNSVQPIWVSVAIPAATPAGNYAGTITVKADKIYSLQLTIQVLNKLLPPPSQWKFKLDFWQHPAAIARVHRVSLWSDAHFALMKKYYSMLAKAGQKNITASIVQEPWGHQTYDDFPSLVKWTRKKDGRWQYDYRLFDKYVSFVMSCGINKRINCYSMVPWNVAFPYYDESLGRDTVFTGEIGSAAYNEFWKTMLTDFTRHLKAKGWFRITAIAMDERPMPAMKAVIRLLKDIDKDWKISLAGDYHGEIEKDVDDYCIASRFQFPADTLRLRQKQGKISTWYTCCVEKYPNGFTFSPPAEHVWLGWYTAAKNMDGYLRWAFNSWPKDPLRDSRFTSWPAGDTYQIYPGPISSIRFEKLIEGIQDFEKINLLRDQYKVNKQTEKLQRLEEALAKFDIEKLSKQSAESMVVEAKSLLNE